MAIIGIIGSKVLRMSENFFPLLYVLTDYACIIIHGICSMLLYLPFHSSLDSPCTRCGHMVCMCSRRTLQFSWFISERGPAKDSFDAMTHPTVFVSNQGIMIGWYEQSLCLQSKGEEKKKKSSAPRGCLSENDATKHERRVDCPAVVKCVHFVVSLCG